MKPAGITFDAFGTLFDLSALRTRTRSAAGHEGDELFAAFRNRLIPWTWHVTASGDYEPFPDIAAKALMGAAREAGFPLERSRADWIVEGLTSLPAFDDVGPGLDRLAELGVPLAILTNGTVDGITAVVENSGLNGRFAHLLSVDTVRRFKPARETYGLVEPAFGRPLGEILFVTAHEWDVAGAKAAGMQTAFLARGERCAPVLGREPDIEAPDLPELAYILAR